MMSWLNWCCKFLYYFGLVVGILLVTKDSSVLAQDAAGTCANDDNGGQCGGGGNSNGTASYSMGVEQLIDSTHEDAVKLVISDAETYVKDVVMTDERYEPVRSLCINKHANCAFWAALGECYNNADYMKINCAPVCKSCEALSHETRHMDVLDEYGSEIGVKQEINDAVHKNNIRDKIAETRKYIAEVVMKDEKYIPSRTICKNKHEKCAFWAVIGECQNNPGYMKTNCAPVCNACDQLQIETRCPLDPEAPDAWKPGDLNKMFERITTDPTIVENHQPKVVSRPDYINGDTAETADYLIGPWIITIENAMTEEEAERLIELGAIEGYKRSSDVGKRNLDGTYSADVNEGRTSTNAWCIDECYNDPLAQKVSQRIVNITGIPEENSENLQLLRYEVGQFYQSHHDYIPHHVDRQSGVRILTVYYYLNDVEKGGNTKFTKLGIEVEPRRGRAVIWPSVLDENPNEKDPRTDHEAMAVIEGIKYGANAWLHQRDFKTPNKNGCV